MADTRPKKDPVETPIEAQNPILEAHPLDDAIEKSKENIEAGQKKRGRKAGGKNKPKEAPIAKRAIVGTPEFNLQVQESKDMVGEILNMPFKAAAASKGIPELELDKDEKDLLGTEGAKLLAYYVPQMSESQSVIFGALIALASVSFNKSIIYMKHAEMQAAKNRLE